MTVHHIRSFETGAAMLNDRVLSARFVPYGKVANVVDVLDDGTIDRYREGFTRGVFGKQAATKERGNLARIQMRHLHDRSAGVGYLGHVIGLHEEDDGLYGEVSVIPSRADDVDSMLRNGVDGMSIEFQELRNGTTVDRDGVRWRNRAALWAVSLEPVGAFAGARVLSYRADGTAIDDTELDDDTPTDPPPPDEPPPPDDEPPGEDAEQWLASARERQAELDRRFRPRQLSEEERRLEALHDEAVAAYRSA